MDSAGPTAALRSPSWGRGLGQAALTAMVVAATLLIYLGIEHDGALHPLVTRTRIDDLVPLWPRFIWIYLLPYALAPVLMMRLPPSVFEALLARALVLIVIQLLGFALWPTIVDRPLAPAGESWSVQLLRLIYEVDNPPRNAAPSQHVSTLVVLAWALSRAWPRATLFAWVFALVVFVSVLVTGQHHVLDVVTGAALGTAVLLAFAGVERLRRRRAQRPAA